MLVVDNVRLTREGLTELLLGRGMTASGCASAAISLVDALTEFEPDIAMLNAATVDIVAAAGQIRRHRDDVAVVAIGVIERAEDVVRCATARLAGFTMASDPIGALVQLIASADAWRAQCPAAAVPILMAAVSDEAVRPAATHLSQREREVVQLIAEGLANKEIAVRLGITLRTVKNHLHHAYGKLDVHSRTEAAAVFTADVERRDIPGY